MGLLDDAIREHLDLKRKHGAGDEELRRQETEALGPARRDFSADAANAEPAAAAPAEAAPTAAPEPAETAGWLDDEPGGAPFDAAAEAPPPRKAAARRPGAQKKPAPEAPPTASQTAPDSDSMDGAPSEGSASAE